VREWLLAKKNNTFDWPQLLLLLLFFTLGIKDPEGFEKNIIIIIIIITLGRYIPEGV